MKGVITYMLKGEQYSEEFFLEPSDGTKGVEARQGAAVEYLTA